MKTMTNNMTI